MKFTLYTANNPVSFDLFFLHQEGSPRKLIGVTEGRHRNSSSSKLIEELKILGEELTDSKVSHTLLTSHPLVHQ